MGNQIKGKFSFKAKGETFALQYTANAMCELEDATGKSATAFLQRLENTAKEDLSFSDVRLLFWAGLQEHHAGLTVKDAGDLITGLGGIVAALELVGKAVAASMPAAPKAGAGGNTASTKKPKGTS